MNKNILFVVDERMMGGVSTVLEDILNNISLKNKNIDLLILHNRGDKLVDIPKEINVIYGTKFFNVIDLTFKDLLIEHNIIKILKKIYIIFLLKTGLIKYKIKKERKKILSQKYDTEIAFKHGFTTLFVIYGDSKKKINWLHCDCELNDPAKKYHSLFNKILPLFDYNILLSESLKKSFNKIYNCNNIEIINNIIDSKKVRNNIKNSNKNKDGISFIAIGRYSYEKSYDRLIKAFIMLKKDKLLENVHLDLYGAGPMKEELITLVNSNKLNDIIKINSSVTNPYKYMHDANMFILSSYTEGYPLVIIESLLSGTPVLSTDIKSAKEMINNKTGIITDNSINGLYKALKNIILNQNIISELTDNLKKYEYDNDRIIKQIERLLDNEKH